MYECMHGRLSICSWSLRLEVDRTNLPRRLAVLICVDLLLLRLYSFWFGEEKSAIKGELWKRVSIGLMIGRSFFRNLPEERCVYWMRRAGLGRTAI